VASSSKPTSAAVTALRVDGYVRSVFKRPPARAADPGADHLYNRAATSRNDLSLRYREAFMDEACDYRPVESVNKREQVPRDSVRNAPK
jgi:hypothetical protein